MSTAIEQDAPLQNILADMSRDYERLNDLNEPRESDLMGRSILIIMFVSVGLPFLIAFIVGLFAPRTKDSNSIRSIPHSHCSLEQHRS